jgi:hypothetical protein
LLTKAACRVNGVHYGPGATWPLTRKTFCFTIKGYGNDCRRCSLGRRLHGHGQPEFSGHASRQRPGLIALGLMTPAAGHGRVGPEEAAR